MAQTPDSAHRCRHSSLRGFTLLELLVVIAIIGILAAMIFAVTGRTKETSYKASCISNMRQMGIALNLFAGENNFELPGRVSGASGNTTDKWPRALSPYVKDTKVYAAPGDPESWIAQNRDPLDNNQNNTSFIMNGYNDLLAGSGNLSTSNISIRTTLIERPSQVILFGMPVATSNHFYMDLLEGPNGNQVDVLNLKVYSNGSCYLFADGSARFILAADHDVKLWLVNKDYVIP